jgi:hypothetical protein
MMSMLYQNVTMTDHPVRPLYLRLLVPVMFVLMYKVFQELLVTQFNIKPPINDEDKMPGSDVNCVIITNNIESNFY